jgi:hypothetical protein
MTTYTWDKQIQIDNAITALNTPGDTSALNAINAQFTDVFQLLRLCENVWHQRMIFSDSVDSSRIFFAAKHFQNTVSITRAELYRANHAQA